MKFISRTILYNLRGRVSREAVPGVALQGVIAHQAPSREPILERRSNSNQVERLQFNGGGLLARILVATGHALHLRVAKKETNEEGETLTGDELFRDILLARVANLAHKLRDSNQVVSWKHSQIEPHRP